MSEYIDKEYLTRYFTTLFKQKKLISIDDVKRAIDDAPAKTKQDVFDERVMMFRGICKDTGKPVYGSHCSILSKDMTSVLAGEVKDEHYIIDRKKKWNEVIPTSVGMYSGYKDKNQYPIYEHDKLQYEGKEYTVKFGEHETTDGTVRGFYLSGGWLEVNMAKIAEKSEVKTCF